MSDDKPDLVGLKRIKWLAASLTLAALALAVLLSPEYVRLLDVDLDSAVKIVAALFLVTAFVERAIQVIIGIWVEPGRVEIRGRIRAARARAAAGDAAAAEDEAAQRVALDGYRAATGRLAFTIAFLAGIAVSWVGVRSLRTLVDPSSYAELGGALQRHLFTLVDVVVTGGLIAGGTKGMHELMQVITEFFGKARDKIDPNRNNP